MELTEKLAQFNANLPLEEAHTIPASWYLDQEIEKSEYQKVFADSWQIVGRMDQLQQPGSFFTAEIAGEPIVVVRDDEKNIRAFSNVCRHRAARVMESSCGIAKRLRCRYHGWTYDLQGNLRGVPEFQEVKNFPREKNGLPPLEVATWGQFVFVHLGKPQQSLIDFLQPFPEKSAFLIENLEFVERKEYVLCCNWKIFVDNFLDGGYHVNTVHPGLASVIDYSGYRTDVFENNNVQISPMSTNSDKEDVKRVRTGKNAYYWWIFPNFMVNIYDGIMDTNLVLPLSQNKCRIIFDFYFATDTPRDFIKESVDVSHQIQLEDVGVCEEVQKGLASKFFTTGRFSARRETAGYHFHRLLAKKLKE